MRPLPCSARAHPLAHFSPAGPAVEPPVFKPGFLRELARPFLHQPHVLAESSARLRTSSHAPRREDCFITFEWIDPDNLLGEIPRLGTDRHRGAGSTAIDAVALYVELGRLQHSPSVRVEVLRVLPLGLSAIS